MSSPRSGARMIVYLPSGLRERMNAARGDFDNWSALAVEAIEAKLAEIAEIAERKRGINSNARLYRSRSRPR